MRFASHDDLGLPSDDLQAARVLVAGFEPVAGLSDADREAQRDARDQILAFVDMHPDALLRSCLDGHLTGSALIADPSRGAVLLMHHRKLSMWLQMGGHADGEANLALVALREATEESGLTGLGLSALPVDVDVHLVRPPSEPPHLHLDVRYLALAPPGADAPGNAESTDLRWFPPDEALRLGVDASTARLVRLVQLLVL